MIMGMTTTNIDRNGGDPGFADGKEIERPRWWHA
jgi:hypothetical protein